MHAALMPSCDYYAVSYTDETPNDAHQDDCDELDTQHAKTLRLDSALQRIHSVCCADQLPPPTWTGIHYHKTCVLKLELEQRLFYADYLSHWWTQIPLAGLKHNRLDWCIHIDRKTFLEVLPWFQTMPRAKTMRIVHGTPADPHTIYTGRTSYIEFCMYDKGRHAGTAPPGTLYRLEVRYSSKILQGRPDYTFEDWQAYAAQDLAHVLGRADAPARHVKRYVPRTHLDHDRQAVLRIAKNAKLRQTRDMLDDVLAALAELERFYSDDR